MNDKIQIIEITENGNVEVYVGEDVVHTAASFEDAAAWLTRERDTTMTVNMLGRSEV